MRALPLLLACALAVAGCATAPPGPIPTGPETAPPAGCKSLRQRGGICSLDWAPVQAAHAAVHRRFRYRADRIDYWQSDAELPETGLIVGDCEDHALAVRRELRRAGIASRLALVLNPDGWHLVTESGGWISDNRYRHVKRWTDLPYRWVMLSGYGPGDPWRRVAGH